jgi:CBS domain containing-hemolysin-like protein
MLTGEMHGLLLLQCVAVAMLILTNGFFVAAEFALVSIRETRIEQMLADRVPGARAVRLLQRELDDFLPAVQLGVTLCSLALGWIGEPLVAGILLNWMRLLPHTPAHITVYAHVAAIVAVALGFCVITYLHVVLGELVPKSLALRRADALAVAVAPPMLLFMGLARPAVRLLSRSAAAVLRGFDIPMTERATVHSPEELKLIATAARRMGLLPKFQETLIHRALELDEVPVREIMTPRQKIFSLPSNMLIEEASALVIEQMHSRVPVYDETRGPEHIVGVVYSKDLSRLMFFRPSAQRRRAEEAEQRRQGAAKFVPAGAEDAKDRPGGVRYPATPFVELRLKQVMRDVLVVPETKTVLDLIRDFQKRRRQMAIVVDEYGSTVGLVTAEDAIEQLTGELEDEFDDPARPVLANAQGSLVLEGSANLRDLETQMQWSLPREGGVETLAGFMLTRLGHIPKIGETVEYEDRRLAVVEMEGRRIAKIRVDPIEKSEPNPTQAT